MNYAADTSTTGLAINMTSPKNETTSVLVAGAGIGGLTLAIALARSGLSVDVVERARQPEDTGAGIQLGPNAVHVLDALDVLRSLENVAFEPNRAVIRRFDTGYPLLESALNPGHQERYGQKYLHVHRADLLDALTAAATNAGVKLRFGVTANSFDQDDDTVTLNCEGSRCSANVLVGADGIHSSIRKHLIEDTPARFTGQAAWRALIPADAVPEGLISPDANVWVGPGKHFVAYYVRGGTLINVVAVQEQSEWAEESWRTEGNVDELRTAFRHWDPRIGQLLEACEFCYFWGLFDRPELHTWYDGRVVLLGDACHPMLPFMAQGAAMAIEDAWVLSQQLSNRTNSLEHNLATYQQTRQSRTTAVRALSNKNARMYHASQPLEVALRNLKLAVGSALPAAANSVLDDVYGLDVTQS